MTELIEKINSFEKGNIKFAVFDFDGTLSLIREGWQAIMIPMMVDYLKELNTNESDEALEAIVKKFVTDLTGKQTIYQMIRLCEEIEKRGGTPKEPLFYKNDYHDRLLERINYRLDGLREGTIEAKDYLVSGSMQILELMKSNGVKCYLASGTDEKYVLDEVSLLGLTDYFEAIYGAQDDYKNFSKRMVIQKIIADNNLHGSEVVAFGDGYVEIEEMKSVGGIAIGLATDEATRDGIDEWKRSRLIAANADVIIPDFSVTEGLKDLLF